MNDNEEAKKEVRTVKLSKKWCGKQQLGTVSESIEYMDYSGSDPVKERLEFDIELIPAVKKKYLMAVASESGEITDYVEVQDNFEALMVAESVGMDISDILDMKDNKSIGIYESISQKVQEVNGMFSSLNKKNVEALKNSEGQENSTTS